MPQSGVSHATRRRENLTAPWFLMSTSQRDLVNTLVDFPLALPEDSPPMRQLIVSAYECRGVSLSALVPETFDNPQMNWTALGESTVYRYASIPHAWCDD